MKKDLLFHFSFAITYFAIITVFRQQYNLGFLPLWLGAVVGTLMPDIDHLIYVYILRPQDISSQRVRSLVDQKQVTRAWNTVVATKEDRPNLIFHSARFLLIFILFTFLIVTSGNLFGRGIVLGFLLHLVVDMAIDIVERKGIDHWFRDFPVALDSKQRMWFFGASVLLTVFFGFF